MATKNGSALSLGRMMKFESSEDFSYMRDNVEYRNAVYFMLCTILFFQFVNWVLKSQGPPKSLKDDEWKWRNLYVSWLHATICSIWTLTSFFVYPELLDDLLQHVNYFTYFNVCFATAYFAYDFLDLLLNNKIFSMWEVTLHHIAVGGMFYYNVHIKSYIAFNLVALLVEVNSLFLHWRKLLQMVGTPYTSRKYVTIKHMNLASFIMFRFLPCAHITISIFFLHNQASRTYLVLIIMCMFFLDVLNCVLFSRLFKSDILRGAAERKITPLQAIKQDLKFIAGFSSGIDGLSNRNLFSNNNEPDGKKHD